MNLVGIPKQGAPIDARSYFSIVIANISVSGDRGINPNPTKPWLEASLIEVDKKKKIKVSEGDSLPLVSLHVSMIDIEVEEKKKDKSFHILLDNVLYGPFSRIKITPAMMNEDILTMPFMTYFPLDLPF